MLDDWPLLREKFHRAAAEDGVEIFAKRIPIHFTTAYRLIKGETRRPQRMTREGIRRALAERYGERHDSKPVSGDSG